MKVVAGRFAIEYPDLPGCISDGSTPEEAFKQGCDAVKSYLLSCARHGDTFPKPSEASGQWRQRVPRSLHALLAVKARHEGVSLNTLVTAPKVSARLRKTGSTDRAGSPATWSA
ncbi:MAG: type II toxin-antitoxin system HicB family antitoxin [Acidobacteria bacterium]|nr:type II toxin-antitoxin system HicB family antitoxin [Acidobacteriota bacterium]